MKNVFTIESSLPFLETLASEIWRRCNQDGFLLSKYLILLPTRRSCRYLANTFAHIAAGKPILLPRIQPLGDIDEDEMTFFDNSGFDLPPAIAPLKRLMLLTQQVQRRDPSLSLDQAAKAADALARFLDQIQIERCDTQGLPELVKEKELAEHWQETLRFLEIVTKNWPLILKDQESIDPAARRNAVLELQTNLWRQISPDFPVVAAGSTGSIPATADLLNVIASMSQGTVVLPGLDRTLDQEAWDEIDDTHPQYTMKMLLARMEVDRTYVKDFGDNHLRSSRSFLLSEAMRPASCTESWRTLHGKLESTSIKGLTALTLDHPQEEAQVIALRLREIMQHKSKTAAFITADRDLAVRVGTLLRRWDIHVDDSAGTPLSMLPVGSFFNLVLAAASPEASTVNLLALLKHPFAACGLTPLECRRTAREGEMRLRRAEYEEFTFLKERLLPLTSLWMQPVSLGFFLETHIKVCESIASSDAETGSSCLWKGESGEHAAAWLDEWRESASGFPPLFAADYSALFGSLMSSKIFRSGRVAHPRLSILGPLEARLIHADLFILGGLNENTWPPDVGFDPWMSRSMRKKFRMTTPEYRIGLSAHDFVQASANKEVFLTRSLRRKGTPTLPSRFLLQIDAVLRAAGLSDTGIDGLAPQEPWRQWAKMLDAPTFQEFKTISRPQPRPPLELRPIALSITDVSTWLRNPYAIYAKYVLKLTKLEELDIDLDASDRGIMIHQALEQFACAFPKSLPADAETQLLRIGQRIFLKDKSNPRVRAFWWAHFTEICKWYVAEQKRRQEEKIQFVAAEPDGVLKIDTITFHGRADRIDRDAHGKLSIIDYKTGAIPAKTEVVAGLEPQLPLLALMASLGGFDAVEALPSSSLEYWLLRGGKSGCKVTSFKDEQIKDLVEKSEKGLRRLVAAFANEATPYEAVPKPRIQPKYNDYAHLARLAEWGRTEGET